ncbi:MAG: hypothetical protein QM619_03575 [Micropruina sp.]|uniref:hypothetical protein n=1 Tax=Micropruina sp. TaxID=2737536 RepID=UPI0039E2DBF2
MAENENIANRPSDPFVAARINDPAAGPPATLTLVGLLGDSDRPGRRRLYLSTRLDYWVEVRNSDVLAVEDVGPDQPPFQGLDATRLTVVRDAQLDYVRTAGAGAADPFSVQPMTAAARPMAALAETWEAECPGPSWGDCPTDIGCPTANECPSGWTVCKPRTCRETQGATCQTCDTCRHTCDTCHGGTCRTCGDGCPTRGDATCVTCPTGCATTCGPTCAATCLNTCAATCANTCANTCAATCGATCGATCRFTCTPDVCETVGRCPTFAQTHCNTCRC